MSELRQKPSNLKRSVWLSITVGWLAQLGLKTILPIVVLIGLRFWPFETNSQALWLENYSDSNHPAWYALQAAIFIGSAIAGGLAAMLGPRRSLIVPAALIVLSLLATAFEQFPRPLSSAIVFIWAGGPCVGLIVGVVLVRFFIRDEV